MNAYGHLLITVAPQAPEDWLLLELRDEWNNMFYGDYDYWLTGDWPDDDEFPQ